MQESVAICLPCYSGEVNLAWMGCYVGTHDLLTKEGIKLEFVSICGNGLIPAARSELLTKALETGAEKIIFVDQKQLWEPVGVLRMLRDLEGHDMVCAPCATTKGDFHAAYTGETDGFLREASHSAIAFAGIRRKVVLGLQAHYGDLKYQGDGVDHYALFHPILRAGKYIGEDLAFSIRVRAAGYKLWVDESIRVRRLM